MTNYITRDSGQRQEFASGAHRDISEGKTRYDLIPVDALHRWGDLMGRGAIKYGDWNWAKGMPASRFYESALRHLFTYIEGDRAEDHLAAVLFNIGAIMYFEGSAWDDINGEDRCVETHGEIFDPPMIDSNELADWILKWEEPAEPANMINWEQLRLDVESGKIEDSTVAWPDSES